jgi:hypothetical protein
MGYVYAGQGVEKDRFKIGRAADLKNRTKQHRTSQPEFAVYRSSQTDNPREAEKSLKRRFADSRIPGTTEWFKIRKENVHDEFAALENYMQTTLSVSQHE